MQRLSRLLALVLFTIAFLVSTSTQPVETQGTPTFGVSDLGAGVTPSAMQQAGFPILAGARLTPAGNESRGFVGAVGSFMALGTLGGLHSVAHATNGSHSAGESGTASGAVHAFVSDFQGQMTDLGTLGGRDSRAYGINDVGVIVGTSSLPSGTEVAFVYRDGVMSPLGATLGGPNSAAFDINNTNQVVGFADFSGHGDRRAFLYQNGTTTNLGSLGGRSRAFAINDAGVVVGASSLTMSSPSETRAFRWENGVMENLGTLDGEDSYAMAINEEGVIVGWVENEYGYRRAVMWRDGVIIDLNTLVPPGSGWELMGATGVGFKNAIIGWGFRDGEPHGFMLTPPFDVELKVTRHQNEVATNIPSPHEAGALLLGVSVFNQGDFAPTGLTIRDTITGPIEYHSWTGGDCVVERAEDSQALTCTVAPFEFFGRDIMIETRSTGAGSITHSAQIIDSEHLDSNSSNDAESETNTAVVLHRLQLGNSSTGAHSVVGGEPVLTRATLSSVAPPGGARVRLTSSHPDIAKVPPYVDVLPWANGGLYRDFYITTLPVAAQVNVDIIASYGASGTVTTRLAVMPPGVSWAYGGTAHAVPGTIQAEDFDHGGEGVGYHDLSVNNDGGAYRRTDVDLEPTADIGGGFNVGWMNKGEWLAYTVNVQTAGEYQLVLRVASEQTGRVSVEFDSVDKTGPLVMHNTSGWQNWTDMTARITLAAGTQRMRVIVEDAYWMGVGNLNYIRLTSLGATTTPFAGAPVSLPGIVQAEDFDNGGEGAAYHDVTAANSGNSYRPAEGVDIQPTTDAGGGQNVGWMAAGEWLRYSVNVDGAAGTYPLAVRVAAQGDGGTFHIEFDGVDKTGPMTIPNTGGWQSWYSLYTNVALNAGTQRMRIVIDAAGPTGVVGNINYVQVLSQPSTRTPTDIVMYATDVMASSMNGRWTRVVDNTTPGMRIQTPDESVSHANSPLALPLDYFEVAFTPLANQPYAIWLRMKALDDSKWNDSVWVQFSGAHAGGGPVYQIGTTSGLLVNLATDATAASLHNWGWQDGAYWLAQHTTVTFPAGGTQTMRIQVREDGAQIDQIVLSPRAYRTGPPGSRSNDTTLIVKPLTPYP